MQPKSRANHLPRVPTGLDRALRALEPMAYVQVDLLRRALKSVPPACSSLRRDLKAALHKAGEK